MDHRNHREISSPPFRSSTNAPFHSFTSSPFHPFTFSGPSSAHRQHVPESDPNHMGAEIPPFWGVSQRFQKGSSFFFACESASTGYFASAPDFAVETERNIDNVVTRF